MAWPFLLLGLAAAAPAQLPPVGTAAAYEVNTYNGRHAAPGDPMSFSHGDGGYPPIRLIRLPDTPSGRPRFEIGSASAHHSRIPIHHVRKPDPEEQRWLDHQNLEESLDHHRPTVTYEDSKAGWIRTEHAAAAAFERCAVRTARSATRHFAAEASDPEDKKRWRRTHKRSPLQSQWNAHEFRAAQAMLALMALPKAGFGEGSYLKTVPARAAKRLDRPEWDARAWRDRAMLAHGQEFRWEIPAHGSSAAARLCRTLEPPKLKGRITDRCVFNGVLDSRDGWPIVIGVYRGWKDARGASSNSGILAYRLPPKSNFTVPPNPCAAAFRGNPAGAAK